MENKATVIGCANEYLPVIFDMCSDIYGITDFYIYKNIEVDGIPEMPVENQMYSCKMYEPEEKFNKQGEHIFFGVTGPYGKRKVFEYFEETYQFRKHDIDSLIHPSAIISGSSALDSAVQIEPGVVISSQTRLGFAVNIKRNSSAGHHCHIDDFVEINPGVIISGGVKIGKGTIIGSGAVLKDKISIGEHSIIGMGSVVTKDIPSRVVAYGNPCKVVRENPSRV